MEIQWLPFLLSRRAELADVGGVDYEDAGQSRSKNSERKRSASMTWATRQFGAPAARRVWPFSPTAIRAGCHCARPAGQRGVELVDVELTQEAKLQAAKVRQNASAEEQQPAAASRATP